MNRFILNCQISGAAGGVLSHLDAAAASRVERGNADLAMHAVSHIAWGDDPRSHTGRHLHNTVIGTALQASTQRSPWVSQRARVYAGFAVIR